MKARAKHLVIASFDGVATHYCGVGEVVRNMIRVLSDIGLPADVKVSLAYIAADPIGKVFNAECFRQSSALVSKTGGCLLPIFNGTPGFDEGDMWKSFPEWHHGSVSLATSLNLILEDCDDTVLILHGTPFLAFPKFKQQMFGRKCRAFYFLHSTGLSHTFGDDNWRKERIKLEKECFSLIEADPRARIVAVGENFARHLTSDYGANIPESCIVRNGLYLKQYHAFLQKRFGVSDLVRFNLHLPKNSRIIFSWGRCSIVKGFKELLETWEKVQAGLPYHYLILQAPDNSGEDDYSGIIRDLASRLPRTVLVNNFNPEIWQTILRCSNTDIVCIPSLRDTNPLTAMEAKFFSAGMNYVIIASKRDGLKDSFSDGECYWLDPDDQARFARTIVSAAETGDDERQRMRANNYRSMTGFDYSKNFGKFLNEFDCI